MNKLMRLLEDVKNVHDAQGARIQAAMREANELEQLQFDAQALADLRTKYGELLQKKVRLTQELDDAKTDYKRACQTITSMHAAAVGGMRCSNRGVVEDVADLKTAHDKLRAENEELRAKNERFNADLVSAKQGEAEYRDAVTKSIEREIVLRIGIRQALGAQAIGAETDAHLIEAVKATVTATERLRQWLSETEKPPAPPMPNPNTN